MNDSNDKVSTIMFHFRRFFFFVLYGIFILSYSQLAAINLLPNADFEEGLQGWNNAKDNGMSSILTNAAYSGKMGLRVSDADPKAGSSLISLKQKAEAGKKYSLKFSGRILSEKGSLAVYLRFFDGAGKQLNPYPNFMHLIEFRDTPTWKPFEKTFESPVGTEFFDVWIHSYDSVVVEAELDQLEVNLLSQSSSQAPQGRSANQEKWLTEVQIASLPKKRVASAEATPSEKAIADFTCNGVADEEFINQAATQAKVIELLGPSFTIASPIKLGDNILLGAGSSKTTIKMSGKMDTGIFIRGNRTLIGDAKILQKGATNFPWTLTASNLLPRAGSYVLIHSDDWFTGTRGYYWKGEVARVSKASIDSMSIERLDDSDSSKIGLWDNYTNNVHLYQLNLLTDVGIQGIRLIGPASTIRHRLIRAEFLLRPFFRDLVLDGLDSGHEGLSANPVVDILVENCLIQNISDSMSTTYSTGYGYYISGHMGLIRNCVGKRNRHSFEWGGYSSATVKTPVTRRLIALDCSASEDWSSSFSTHDPCEANEWVRCQSIQSGGGFIMRGTAWTLIEPKVLGIVRRERPSPDWWGNHKSWSYDNAIYIGERTQQGGTDPEFGGIGGCNSKIIKANIDLTECVGANSHLIYAEDNVENLQVLGGRFISSPTSAIGVRLRGLLNRSILFDGVRFDMSLQSGNSFMEVNPGDDSSSPIDVTLQNCEIIKPFNAEPLVLTRNPEGISLKNNRVDSRQ